MLRLSSHAMNNISTGEITNLLANDATKIEPVPVFFNYLWVNLYVRTSLLKNNKIIFQLAPFQLAMVICLFWYFARYVAFLAIGYTLLLLILQPAFSRLFVHLRFVLSLSRLNTNE